MSPVKQDGRMKIENQALASLASPWINADQTAQPAPSSPRSDCPLGGRDAHPPDEITRRLESYGPSRIVIGVKPHKGCTGQPLERVFRTRDAFRMRRHPRCRGPILTLQACARPVLTPPLLHVSPWHRSALAQGDVTHDALVTTAAILIRKTTRLGRYIRLCGSVYGVMLP